MSRVTTERGDWPTLKTMTPSAAARPGDIGAGFDHDCCADCREGIQPVDSVRVNVNVVRCLDEDRVPNRANEAQASDGDPAPGSIDVEWNRASIDRRHSATRVPHA